MGLERLRRPVQEIGEIGHVIRDPLLEGPDPAIERFAGVDHALGKRVELQDEIVDPQTRPNTQVNPGDHHEVGEHPGESTAVNIGVQAHEVHPLRYWKKNVRSAASLAGLPKELPGTR